jgi:tRNA pseudouridine38-40 synthase
MARFFLTLSYNGSEFNGWQVQENTAATVQQVITEKLSMLLREQIKLTGCGRTDTGVNARNYVAHFDCGTRMPLDEKQNLIYKLNTVLPQTISVSDIRQVKKGAHARYDAAQRVYHYYLIRKKNPFRSAFTWYVHGDLDFNMMNAACEKLYGHTDFTSFSKVNTQNKTNNCKISKAVWQMCGEDEWRFTISADRFLRGMVRAIVGTMVMVGRKKIGLQDFENIILAKNRAAAGNNAPANALFLAGIKYPEEVYYEH